MNNIFKCTVVMVIAISLLSCEKIPISLENQEVVIDQNISVPPIETTAITPAPAIAPPKIKTQEPVDHSVKVTKIDTIIEKAASTQPVVPTFSDELLTAVKNWTRIPKSVFPARPILSSVPVTLTAKTSTGDVIANAMTPPGYELQVLGIKGNTLIVANLNNTRLRGEVNIDDTDFKQLLAYRFELNLKKRAEIQRKKQEALSLKNKAETPPKNEVNQDIMDVIPDPLDFGHGRFCICKDCREKRLAKTGSLKTGFGLEP